MEIWRKGGREGKRQRREIRKNGTRFSRDFVFV